MSILKSGAAAAALAFIALIACADPGNRIDPDPKSEGQGQTLVPPPVPPAAVPVVSEATLPTLAAIHEGEIIPARRFQGCWTPDSSSDLQVRGRLPPSASSGATPRSGAATRSMSKCSAGGPSRRGCWRQSSPIPGKSWSAVFCACRRRGGSSSSICRPGSTTSGCMRSGSGAGPRSVTR